MSSLQELLTLLSGLRRWILGFGATFAALCIPGWLVSGAVIADLRGLLSGETLYETFVGEVLWSRVTVAAVLALMLLAPGICWALSRRPVLCAAGTALFAAGFAFGRLVLLPFTVTFLRRAGEGFAESRLSQFSYVSMCLGLTAAAGLVFLLPLALRAAYGAGLVTVEGLRKARPRVLLGAVVVMAVLTPTQDAVTLAVATAPVLVLYEASVLWLRLSGRKGGQS